MDANLRNFKDFLQIYNLLSETCFKSCVDNLNSRTLESNEAKCVEDCAEKFIRLNHRFMGIYVESQQLLVQKRLKDAEDQAPQAAVEEPPVSNSNVAIENNSEIPVTNDDNLIPQAKDVSVS